MQIPTTLCTQTSPHACVNLPCLQKRMNTCKRVAQTTCFAMYDLSTAWVSCLLHSNIVGPPALIFSSCPFSFARRSVGQIPKTTFLACCLLGIWPPSLLHNCWPLLESLLYSQLGDVLAGSSSLLCMVGGLPGTLSSTSDIAAFLHTTTPIEHLFSDVGSAKYYKLSRETMLVTCTLACDVCLYKDRSCAKSKLGRCELVAPESRPARRSCKCGLLFASAPQLASHVAIPTRWPRN